MPEEGVGRNVPEASQNACHCLHTARYLWSVDGAYFWTDLARRFLKWDECLTSIQSADANCNCNMTSTNCCVHARIVEDKAEAMLGVEALEEVEVRTPMGRIDVGSPGGTKKRQQEGSTED